MSDQYQAEPDAFLNYQLAEELGAKRRADPMVAGLRKVCVNCKRPFRATMFNYRLICGPCK